MQTNTPCRHSVIISYQNCAKSNLIRVAPKRCTFIRYSTIKEYCTLLQKRQKWATPKRSMKIGDVVLVCNDDSPRNQWPLALVTEVIPSRDNLVRKVRIVTAKDGERKVFERPIHKLVPLLPKEDNENWLVFRFSIQLGFGNSRSIAHFLTEIFLESVMSFWFF